jgi:hypothetical protein
MAEDQWTAQGFTEAPAPKEEAPPPQAAPQGGPPAPPGQWESAGFTPAPAVDYGPMKMLPDKVTAQADVGSTLLKSLKDNVGPTLAAIRAASMKPQDQLVQEWKTGTEAAYSGGVATAKEGIQDILANRSLTGATKVGMGALSAAFAPALGLGSMAQQEATKVTGNEDFGNKVGDIVSLISPFPEARPLIATGDGKMARLFMGEDGKVDATIVGRPPTPVDFKAAASTIVNESGKPEVAAAVEQKLADYWDKGLHPAEVADIAHNSPVMARDLSSATTGPLPLPVRPDPKFINELDDKFFSLRGNHTADQEEILNTVTSWPKEMKDPELQRKLYSYGEGDPTVTLSPHEGDLFNQYILPWRQEATEIYERLKQIGLRADEEIPELDPNYMHRMVKGKTPEIDAIAGESGEANPVFGGPGLMQRSTSSLNERSMMVAEDANGNRRVVQSYDGGIRTVSKDPAAPVDTVSLEGRAHVGDQIKLSDNNTYTIKNAYAREIEEASNIQYYKNAAASAANNLVKLRAVERAAELSQRLRDTPEWAKYTDSGGPRQDGWISPEMPLFKNDVMDPKLAHVIDDFWGQRSIDGLETAITKANNFAVGSLFWTPFPHAFNATAWWVTARGWDNIVGINGLMHTAGNAIREVVTQGPKYQELLRKGTGLVYGSVANKGFYQDLMKGVGVELSKDPGKLAELARVAGFASGYDLIKSIYNASANSLWAVSDMFAVQRVMELERKGMTTEQAIAETERRMINYRKPQEILGSRSAAQAYFNPVVFEFSRYHWGVMSKYAQLAKDLIDVRDPKRSFEALGAVMMLGALQLVVWPGLSAALQAATGNKDLQVPSFGPGRLANPAFAAAVNANPDAWPKYIQNYYKSDNQFMSALAQLAPLSPALRTAGNFAWNADKFSGKPIIDPAAARHGDIGRVAAQAAHGVAKGMIEPYSQADDIYRKGESIPNTVLEQMFGLSEHGDDQEAAKARAFRYQDKQSARAGRKPEGILPDLERSMSQ